jgi:hypothetical protein
MIFGGANCAAATVMAIAVPIPAMVSERIMVIGLSMHARRAWMRTFEPDGPVSALTAVSWPNRLIYYNCRPPAVITGSYL